MKDYLNLIFSLLSKRNIKKFLLGELDPTSEELSIIQTYLENIRPKLLQEDKSNLIQQIEQQKVPYLKELSIVELDFLLSKDIELPELLKIIFAKGGMAKGFAVIEWDNTLLRYKKRKVSFIGIKLIFGILAVFFMILFISIFKSLNWPQGAITLGMTFLFIFVFFPIYGLLGSEQQIQKEIFSHEQYKPFIKE
jgi:hypothetical protein